MKVIKLYVEYEERTFDYDEEFPLHESVFLGNAERSAFLLRNGYQAITKDKHGMKIEMKRCSVDKQPIII